MLFPKTVGVQTLLGLLPQGCHHHGLICGIGNAVPLIRGGQHLHIRLVFPQLTEERRRELSKQVQKMGEEAKVAVRNIRRDANDLCKKMEKDGEMTEDERKASEKAVQDLTDKFVKKIDEAVAAKQADVMSI